MSDGTATCTLQLHLCPRFLYPQRLELHAILTLICLVVCLCLSVHLPVFVCLPVHLFIRFFVRLFVRLSIYQSAYLRALARWSLALERLKSAIEPRSLASHVDFESKSMCEITPELCLLCHPSPGKCAAGASPAKDAPSEAKQHPAAMRPTPFGTSLARPR